MKRKRLTSLLLTTALLLSSAFCVITANAEPDNSTKTKNDDVIAVAFTHDMHSHMENQASLKTAFNELDDKYETLLKLDGGDFSMGTLYQTVYKTQAAELRMLGWLGYDATTLGNHEFDFRNPGLTQMLNSALDSGDRLPYFMATAIDWTSSLADEDYQADCKKLKSVLERYGDEYDYNPFEYTVIEKGDYSIAVFGSFGIQAANYTPQAGLYFYNPVDRAKEIVENIKQNENVDMIVCLSHGGTMEKDSEDEILAEKVPDIDLIISAHTHTLLEDPIRVGNTYIVSCGENCENLGLIELKQNSDGRFDCKNYNLLDVESYKANEKAESFIEKFTTAVNEEYLSNYGYEFDQVLAYNPVTMPSIGYADTNEELTLGNMITDSYIYAVKQAEGNAYVDVDVAVVPSGIVRTGLLKGALTVSDTFNVLSLGSGADGTPGYPLVSIYLTGKELRSAAEIDASVSHMMPEAVLYFSGLQYTYNPHRLFLNRVTEVGIAADKDKKDEYEPVEDDKLYRVVSDLYSAQMLASVNSLSHGLLTIVPKDADGNPLDDYEKHIIYGSFGNTEDGSPLYKGELKSWYCLTSYVDSFNKNSQGISQIPSYYSETHERKLIEDSTAIGDLIKAPNKLGKIVIGIATFILLAILFILFLIIRRFIRKRKSKVIFINNYKF